MATIEREADTTRRNRIALIAVAVLAATVVIALVFLLRRPPQMGADDEVFKTVDALYTAVRSRDEKRLTLCEQRLAAYKAAGKLPKDAADYLDGVIGKARGGNWGGATERLYDFMLAQRREGDHGHAPKQEKPAPTRKGKATGRVARGGAG